MLYTHLTTAQLIAQGRELAAQIATAKSSLVAIEAILRDRALAMPHEPLANGSREGRRATLRDGEQALTVLFESDILRVSFAPASPLATSLETLLLPGDMDALFRRKDTLERRISDGHQFRLACSARLTPEQAAEVIDLLKDRDKNGIVKSKSVIEWTKTR